MINVQPSAPHAALPRAAETSKPTQQKTNDQTNPQTLESTPSRSHARPVLARSRRDLQNTDSPAVPRNASVRKFAEALVERGDSELAVGVGNSLIRQRLAGETKRSSDGQDEVTVPPDSTFGKLWSELADALESEPFKSFAEAKLIVTSNLIIGANGDLTEKEDGAIVNFFSHNDAEWAAASAAVLAAVNKLTGVPRRELSFYGRDQAPASCIAQFYGLRLGSINSNDTLSTAGQLLTGGGFSALSSADPLDAPVKQRQREAIQRIVDLPPHALTSILERFTPSTTRQKVQKADQALAQMVSHGLIKEVPEAGQYEMSVVLENIPEHSTFNLVRKNFLSALNGSAFKTFAQENDLDPTSIAINPVSGELTGKVKGVNTQFTLNDVSGWADAWLEIKDAVQQMPTGDDSLVKYPRHASAPLYQVMKFYNEALPHQESDIRRQNWEQRQLISSLGRIVEINQNNGFKALIDTGSSDSESAAVRQRQQAVIGQLENTPVSLSPLESLAAAVKANPGVTEQNAESPAEVLARAEKEMAIAVYRTMLELKADPTKAASTMMQSTPSSLFDLQKTYLKNASNSLGLADFYRKNNVHPGDRVWIPPRDAAEQRSRAARMATQHPQYADLMMHQSAAAAPFSANGERVQLNLADGNSVPFKWVFNFYGISTDPSSAKFAEQLERIGRTQQLSRTSENPQRVAHELHRRIMAVGDSNDRHALINTLVNGKIDQDDSASSMRFVVDPDSSHQPKGVKEARTFLAENHWYIPKSKAESDNLITALRTPIPKSPPLGNHWGFLSTDVPLSENQRSQVIAFVKHTVSGISLLQLLGEYVPQLDKDPEKALDQLLSTPKALEIATALQAEMKGAVTPTSLKQWLLTALVLELDPTAGPHRKTVAGVDLMGVANAGYGSEVIRERFNQHMTAEKGVPSHLAPAATRVLMAGMAPQLLVSDVPKSVTLGSAQWFSFTEAVNRIEWTAPGATANMTYQQVMNYHNIQPISALEAQINSYAQMDPLLDWAAINDGVNKDTYTLDELKNSQKKLQAKMQAIGESKNWLRTHEAPNRRAMTLKVLREAFGTGIDYESRYMIESYGGGITGRHYSLAEIYEAGKLGNDWKQEGHHVDFERLRSKAKTLPVINTEFDKAINADFNLRRPHTVTLSKDMLETLPPEELKSIIYGTVELFNVDSNIKGAGCGMLLFSKYKGVTRTFAVPAPGGQMARIADIDLDKIQLGKEVSLEIDTDAFKNGTAPRKGVRSNVIIRTTDMHLLDSNNQPWPLDVSFPSHEENDRFSPNYAQRRIEKLASVIVDSTYLNKGDFTKLHRNWSSNTLEGADEPSDFFKALWKAMPGASSIDDILEGKFLKAGVDLGIDAAIFIATDGLGEVWNLAKSGARWGAAKISAKFIERFGAKEAENIALTDLTALSTSESLNATGRMQNSQLIELTGDKFLPPANRANGTVVSATGEDARVTAAYQDEKWYPYDSKTTEGYGVPYEEFVPSSPLEERFGDWATAAEPASGLDPALVKQWKTTVGNFREGPGKAAFENGYKHGAAKQVKGLGRNATITDVIRLAQDKSLTAEQVGILVRRYEELAYGIGKTGSDRFINILEPNFGTVTPMPQAVYLSLTGQLSEGQCAGISRLMANAINEGTENVFIQNMYHAAAFPLEPASISFKETLRKVQTQVGGEAALHAGNPRRRLSFAQVVNELESASGTKTLMVASPGHAMAAGVKFEGAEKVFWLEEPNYGLTKFSSAEDMNAGMQKIFNDKKLPVKYRTYSSDRNVLEFEVSDHDSGWAKTNSLYDEEIKTLYTRPINPANLPNVVKPSVQAINMSEYKNVIVTDSTTTLTTRGISDCTAMAIMTDLENGIYKKRMLMHFQGGVPSAEQYAVLKELQAPLAKGGKVIFVGGDLTRSTTGLGSALGQEYKGEHVLLNIMKKNPASASIVTASGIDIKPDGTFELIEGTQPTQVLDARAKADVYDRAD